MRQGNFINQVALSFSLEAYHQSSCAIDPSSVESVANAKRGYLLMVEIDRGEQGTRWECRYAGTADQLQQAWSEDVNLAIDAGVDAARLCNWFEGVLSTAIPTTRLTADTFDGLLAHMKWDAPSLTRCKREPLTLVLASNGALEVERTQLVLTADTLQAIELRLGWLLATGGGAYAPRFALESQAALKRLCTKICRLHAMSMGQFR
ncbi:hypothetical protein [Pseudoxanthomonas japonensis]|uniref:hypothetical protein n=1 Tax=Pseudoxanthomonas japonensis TaxID=69284 RepID=UPI0037485783